MLRELLPKNGPDGFINLAGVEPVFGSGFEHSPQESHRVRIEVLAADIRDFQPQFNGQNPGNIVVGERQLAHQHLIEHDAKRVNI